MFDGIKHYKEMIYLNWLLVNVNGLFHRRGNVLIGFSQVNRHLVVSHSFNSATKQSFQISFIFKYLPFHLFRVECWENRIGSSKEKNKPHISAIKFIIKNYNYLHRTTWHRRGFPIWINLKRLSRDLNRSCSTLNRTAAASPSPGRLKCLICKQKETNVIK